MLFASAAALLPACDQGHQHDQQTAGPQVNIIGANVGPTQALPADGVIQIAFDRLLLPSTVVRQSFILADANNVALEPVVTYDPVTRVVSLSNPNAVGGAWLTVGLPYKVVFGIAKPGDDETGVRAIDGATLAKSSAGELGFLVAAASGVTPGDAPTNFCTDVLPIFTARCSAGQCHGAPTTLAPLTAGATPAQVANAARFPDGKTRPAAGLLLETPDGIAGTAIGRVAQGSNTGARAGIGEAPGALFGIDMPVVDPGNPSNSWLMYKLLLAELPTVDAGVLTSSTCAGTTAQPTEQPSPQAGYQPLGDDERARLGNVVLGSQMPYPPKPGEDDRSQNLSSAELERVRAWIAQGAPVTSCGVCP